MPQAEPRETGHVDRPAPAVDAEPGKAWRKPRSQVAALPFWFDDGQLRVMLITSRGTRRWVIPKGWPIRGLKPHRAAEREAYEEAGLKGQIGKVAVGVYLHEKRLGDGLAVPCEVSVFPLQVTGQRSERWLRRRKRPISSRKRVSSTFCGRSIHRHPRRHDERGLTSRRQKGAGN